MTVEPEGFRIDEEAFGTHGVALAITGELDVATAPQLRDRLTAATDRGAAGIVVDLTAVTFIDSVALGAIVLAKRRLGDAGRLAVVVEPGSYTMLIFEAAGLDAALELFPTRQAAVAHVTSP